jgi:hypothetical protein
MNVPVRSKTLRWDRIRPPPDVVARKRREIALRYGAKWKSEGLDKIIAGKRRGEIERVIRARHRSLPDTDDRDMLLRLWAWHNLLSRRQHKDLKAFGKRLGADLSDDEINAVIQYVGHHSRKFKARTLGKLLGLTGRIRAAERITTIEAIDVTPTQRKRIQKAKHAERGRQRRRAKGAKARAEYLAGSIERTRPWEAEGISRRTWFRRRKKATRSGTGPCQAIVLLLHGTELCHPRPRLGPAPQEATDQEQQHSQGAQHGPRRGVRHAAHVHERRHGLIDADKTAEAPRSFPNTIGANRFACNDTIVWMT